MLRDPDRITLALSAPRIYSLCRLRYVYLKPNNLAVGTFPWRWFLIYLGVANGSYQARVSVHARKFFFRGLQSRLPFVEPPINGCCVHPWQFFSHRIERVWFDLPLL